MRTAAPSLNDRRYPQLAEPRTEMATNAPIEVDPTTRLVVDVWDLALARSLGSADDDLHERWDTAYRRLASSAEHLVALLADVGEQRLVETIRSSGAPPASIDALLERASHRSGIVSFLSDRLRRTGAPQAFSVTDVSAECLVAAGEIVLAVAVAAKLPFASGFLLANGVASAAGSC
jgi:hypothetical protein